MLFNPQIVVWGSIDVREGCGMAEPARLPRVLVAPRFGAAALPALLR
jgi:hypothetical protein